MMEIRHSILFCFAFFILSHLGAQDVMFPDRHSTTFSEAWLSCQTAPSPNPLRGNGHWILYNLNDTYALQNSKIWNFNTPERINSYNNESWSVNPLQGKLADGMRDVMIDISIDGINWQEWGRFTIPIGPGSSMYQGVAGPDFGGKIARYVLITGLSNHGGTCYGLSEIKIFGSIATISSVEDPLKDATITASPNPFNNGSVISLTDFPTGEARISLVDINGREIFSNNIDIQSNNTTFDISGAQLSSGLYFLNISQNGASKSIKLEVIK